MLTRSLTSQYGRNTAVYDEVTMINEVHDLTTRREREELISGQVDSLNKFHFFFFAKFK